MYEPVQTLMHVGHGLCSQLIVALLQSLACPRGFSCLMPAPTSFLEGPQQKQAACSPVSSIMLYKLMSGGLVVFRSTEIVATSYDAALHGGTWHESKPRLLAMVALARHGCGGPAGCVSLGMRA